MKRFIFASLVLFAIALAPSVSYSSDGAETIKTEWQLSDFSLEDGITIETSYTSCSAQYIIETVTLEAPLSWAEQEVIFIGVDSKEQAPLAYNKNTITGILYSDKHYLYGNYLTNYSG